MTDAEKELRSIWTKQGVSPVHQITLVDEIKAKAASGAEVGPFCIVKPDPVDYRRSARMNLWAARMMRLKGDHEAAEAHLKLADLYIKQELRREREAVSE